jgi:subtilisin family serine protease
MGDRYLIVVRDHYLLGGQIAQSSARAAAPSSSSQDPLAMRHVALTQVAQELVKGGVTDGYAMVAALNTVAPAPMRVAPLVAPPRVTVLSGIGALIVDEDDVPSASLARNRVLEVYPNFDIGVTPPVVGAVNVTAPWHRAQMGLPQAETGQGSLVGVLDTGIDTSHPEFAGKTVHFEEFDRLGTPLGAAARDAGDHGTHVCGIISGATCGIAPDADLAVAAVLTTRAPNGQMTGSLLQIAAGLNWLLITTFRPGEAGVDVINASLGTAVPQGGPPRSGYHSFLHTTLRNALLAPGVMMVAAIGNDGARGEGYHGSPGNYDVTFSVGATSRAQPPQVAPFSDWDTSWNSPPMALTTKPDVCAPGVNIYSSVPGPGAYAVMSGTSMATPMVSGAAALLIERTPSLRRNPAALRSALLALATVGVAPTARGGAGQVTM